MDQSVSNLLVEHTIEYFSYKFNMNTLKVNTCTRDVKNNKFLLSLVISKYSLLLENSKNSKLSFIFQKFDKQI